VSVLSCLVNSSLPWSSAVQPSSAVDECKRSDNDVVDRPVHVAGQ
jgi:hypothetical protein